jgi:hypothetical protein
MVNIDLNGHGESDDSRVWVDLRCDIVAAVPADADTAPAKQAQ